MIKHNILPADCKRKLRVIGMVTANIAYLFRQTSFFFKVCNGRISYESVHIFFETN